MFNAEEFQRQLKHWRELERAARVAEERVRTSGQLAKSSEIAALCKDADDKRRVANSYLLEMLGVVNGLNGSPSGLRKFGPDSGGPIN